MPDYEQILSTAKYLGAKYGVNKIYLFGSYARGEANPDSDIDLRIDRGAIKSLFKLSGMRLDFIDALGINVNLLPTDSLDAAFLNNIKDEEVLLYDRA